MYILYNNLLNEKCYVLFSIDHYYFIFTIFYHMYDVNKSYPELGTLKQ